MEKSIQNGALAAAIILVKARTPKIERAQPSSPPDSPSSRLSIIKDPLGIREWQSFEKRPVEDGEDGAVGTNSEGQGSHGD